MPRPTWRPLLATVLIGLSSTAVAVAQPFAFAADTERSSELYRIDLATGVATLLGGTGEADVEALAIRPSDGALFGISDMSDALVLCDPETGACVPVGPLGLKVADPGLEFACDDTLFLATEGFKDLGGDSGALFQVDPASGTATLIGPLGGGFDGQSLAQSAPAPGCASGMYALDGNSADPRLGCVDLATGSVTVIGNAGIAIDGQPAMDFDENGVLWLVENFEGSDIYVIDPATGLATDVGYDVIPAGTGFDGFTIASSACTPPSALDVPVLSPSGLAVLALLLGFVAARLLRRALRPAPVSDLSS